MNVVSRTKDFQRIEALPRREVRRDEAEKWAALLTPIFALPGADVRLRPWQAYALAEALSCQGLWAALPVGQGKTLLTWLLPTALSAERTMLLVPASLLDKTRASFADLARSWRRPIKPVRTETRERLSVMSGARLIEEYQPDLIVIDEADSLSNPRSAASRRIDRYLRAQPSTCVVAMTGTPSRKSILNYWHILLWCLGDRAPMPLAHAEANVWAAAIDDHRGRRPDPGAMGQTLEGARAWYRDRLAQTPGVLIVDEDSCDAPITVRVRVGRECQALNQAYARFLLKQESPSGEPITDPLSRWRMDGLLGLGLFSRWRPPPPEEWMAARRGVAKFVRSAIERSTFTDPLDTEAQVLRAFPANPAVTHWREVEPTFNGQTEIVWISRAALDDCIAWLGESADPGIVWVKSVDFGAALSRETGLPYYAGGGRTASGARLHAAPKGQHLIVSWAANFKGFDLQPWRRQLITQPPQSAKRLEQIFGRAHRAGQDSHVVVDVLATSGGTLDLLETAFSESRGVRDRESLTQKILRAEIVRAIPKKTEANAFRWARKEG